jgi:hypothetical protein
VGQRLCTFTVRGESRIAAVLPRAKAKITQQTVLSLSDETLSIIKAEHEQAKTKAQRKHKSRTNESMVTGHWII